MWSPIVLCLLVGFAYAANNPGWKENTEYVYQIRGRAFSSLDDVARQYSGIVIKAKLTINTESDKLHGQISDAQYAEVHANLRDGWHSYLPDERLTYQQLPLTNKPFHIVMEKGVVKDIIVSKDLSNWEANMIKGIVSQLQLDTEATNLLDSHYNALPEKESYSATFKTVEDTITGVSETLYDIHVLPQYVLQTKPWLVPFPNLIANGKPIEIVKSKNYSNSDEFPMFHYGWEGLKGSDKPGSNHMGKVVERTSISRAVVTGTFDRYTIQNTYTVDEINVRPTLNNVQMGCVVSSMNLTLENVQAHNGRQDEIRNPVSLGSLVYRFNTPYGTNEVHEGQQYHPRNHYQLRHDRRESNERIHETLNRMNIDDDYSRESQERSDEQEWLQERPKLNEVPESPLLPYTIGYKGKSIKTAPNFNVVDKALKLSQQIGQGLQQPENIPQENTLTKYTMLIALTRTMDVKEIQQVAAQLYSQEQQGVKRVTWNVYRDAVAQAGTGPAFLVIQDWINNKKLEKYEAAEVISRVASSSCQPTDEYMKAFYVFVTRPEIQKESYLNETAILSFTNLVRKVYVDSRNSHNQYPGHSFGRFRTEEGRRFVTDELIPYLEQQLTDAVQRGESQNIHLYIRALGNVADRKILQVYEPYLEGKKQASQFQRLMMVLCLDQLIKTHPVATRSVLHKIYQNLGESPETRIAAVYQIMRTNPPTDMLQRMAIFTNIDTSEQVNSAVKSAIETAAELEGAEFSELRKSAQDARPFLTRKPYGVQYSQNLLRSYVVEEMKWTYKQNVHTIADDTTYIPKGFKYTLRESLGDIEKNKYLIHSLVSSVDELIHSMKKQTKTHQDEEQEAKQSKQDSWLSYSKIAQALNLQVEEREQLEGYLHLKLGDIERMLSFDNHTIDMLPEVLEEMEKILKDGKKFNYFRIINSNAKYIAFPTVMGVPFYFNYEEPTVVAFQGEIQASFDPQLSSERYVQLPEKIESRYEVRALVSRKIQGQIGFITPHNHHQYSAGYEKNIQLNLPFNGILKVDLTKKQVQIEAELNKPEENIRLFHYSTWPYTQKTDILNMGQDEQQESQIIYKKDQEQTIERSFGQKSTGMEFRVQITSEEEFWNLAFLYKKLNRHDPLSVWMTPHQDETIQYSLVNFDYMGTKSSNRKIVARVGYQEKYQPEPEQQEENSSEAYSEIKTLEEITTQQEERQREFLKKVGAGIRSAKLQVVDASIVFKGQKDIKYQATAALARSKVSPKSRALVYMRRQLEKEQRQIAMSVKGYFPNTNGLDLLYAMQFDPTSNLKVQFAVGENFQESAKFNALIEMKQSEERKEYLRNHPMFKLAQQEMNQGNQQLYAGANMTQEANLLDRIRTQIQYEQVSEEFLEQMRQVFELVEHFNFFNIDGNQEEKQDSQPKDNELEIMVKFNPHLHSVNVSVRTMDMETKFRDIPVHELAKRLFVVHPVFNAKTRLMGKALEWNTYRPICVMDKTSAYTFDNVTYPIKLGNPWFVMLQYTPKIARREGEARQQPIDRLIEQQTEKYGILVRNSARSQDKKEVKIIYSCHETQHILNEITLEPTESNQRAKVLWNGKELQYDDQHSTDLNGRLVQVYALPNGEVKIDFESLFHVIYDGQRVKVTAKNDKLRDSIQGLCGNFDGEYDNDFQAPEGCILRDPREFETSYALIEQGQHQDIAQYRNQGKQQGRCVYKEVIYANVISDRDAGRDQQQKYQRLGSCTKHQTQFVLDGNKICFTIRPMPVCRSECQSQGTVNKNVEVHCVQKSNVAELWKKQIENGASPDFSLKTPHKTVMITVPKGCSPQ